MCVPTCSSSQAAVDAGRSSDFNGTPVACVLFALDQVAPSYFEDGRVDLVVSGPNEGSNLGAFVYTLSGTQGAAYAAGMSPDVSMERIVSSK